MRYTRIEKLLQIIFNTRDAEPESLYCRFRRTQAPSLYDYLLEVGRALRDDLDIVSFIWLTLGL
jgi:hypothetical protein